METRVEYEHAVIKLAKAFVNADDEYDIEFYRFGLVHAVEDLQKFEGEQARVREMLDRVGREVANEVRI